jgi:biopolymer transport protein ExbD
VEKGPGQYDGPGPHENPRLRTVIRGDKCPFGPIEDIMDILQKANITKFNLVTELEKS